MFEMSYVCYKTIFVISKLLLSIYVHVYIFCTICTCNVTTELPNCMYYIEIHIYLLNFTQEIFAKYFTMILLYQWYKALKQLKLNYEIIQMSYKILLSMFLLNYLPYHTGIL